MSVSSCCSAGVIENTDLCSQCLEHCDEIEVVCEKCDWEGKEEDLDHDGENDSTQQWANYYCPSCHSEELELL